MDASALVKVVVDETESLAVRDYFAVRPAQASSVLIRVEVARAVARRGAPSPDVIDRALDQVSLMNVEASIVRRAATIGPPTLRTLDAIHLASAMELGSDLEAIVTYDGRLADAARALGLPVVTPA